MNAVDPLRITLAFPCKANWNEMKGDERSRWCTDCSRRVYNIESMTRAEVVELFGQSSERVCVKLYRRRDGTVLTRDCPMRWVSRLKRAFVATFVSALVFLGLVTVFGNNIRRLFTASYEPLGSIARLPQEPSTAEKYRSRNMKSFGAPTFGSGDPQP